MSDQPDTPLGVKMLADHLVKVKMQYEEQINDMLVKMRTMEKEKVDMQKQYKQLEDELEQRRNEIFQLKRANTAQYVLEERENWRAMVAQQKQEIDKLKKDLEIAQERTKSLQQQLKEDPEVTESPENVVSLILEKSDEKVTVDGVREQSPIELGPPQPEELKEAADPEVPAESQESQGLQGTGESQESQESQERKEPQELPAAPSLEQELCRLRAECLASQKAIEESKRMNSQLTDQFIRKVDELERDHQERENSLLAAIEALKLKLDLELEKKWELMQEIREEEAEESQRGGLISYLWG